MKKKHRGMTSVRQPMMLNRIKKGNLWIKVKILILIAAVAAGVLAIIFFGFPLIEDLVKGVDPALRYQPTVEAQFTEEENHKRQKAQIGEIFTDKEYKLKNEPYADGTNIVFTTQKEKKNASELDGVALYDTTTGETKLLKNTEKKYDNFLNPVFSGNTIVFLDSMTDGGGRILGYDLETEQQFVIKEYAYALPQLSLSGDRLAFMQWAGDETHRIYVYDVKTREAATVKLYEKEKTRSSAVDISEKDMVWAEHDSKGNSVLKRIVFLEDGTSKYENYSLGNEVYEPKTNGESIVFKTSDNSVASSLMMSVGGAQPIKIADNVFDFGLGDGFVVYTKNEQIYILYTDAQGTEQLTSDITKNLLSSVNKDAICFYDITDTGILEIVKYTYIPEA